MTKGWLRATTALSVSCFGILWASNTNLAFAKEPVSSANAPAWCAGVGGPATDTADICGRIVNIVVNHLGVDRSKVSQNASFIDDLGADSLDTVELVMAFEEEFNITITDEEAEKCPTISTAMKLILDKVAGHAGLSRPKPARETLTALTDANIKTMLEVKNPAVVFFWASWCGPCKQIDPSLEEIAAEMDGKVTFFKVNIDENPEVAATYKVRSIPTLMIFHKGKATDISVGAKPKTALKNWIASAA